MASYILFCVMKAESWLKMLIQFVRLKRLFLGKKGRKVVFEVSFHPLLHTNGWRRGGVDFINNLQAAFYYKNVLRSFTTKLTTVCVCNFLVKKNIVKKAARKLLMKLTIGVNFTNIVLEVFFNMKMFWAGFLYFQFLFEFLWRKEKS